MAAGEHQAQDVVGDRVRLLVLDAAGDLASDQRVLVLQRRAAPHQVDRLALGGGGQPAARVRRDALDRPRLQRGHERVLREILGDADVAHEPCDGRDHARGLDSPDRVEARLRHSSATV
jgi:hypothetical protein